MASWSDPFEIASSGPERGSAATPPSGAPPTKAEEMTSWVDPFDMPMDSDDESGDESSHSQAETPVVEPGHGREEDTDGKVSKLVADSRLSELVAQSQDQTEMAASLSRLGVRSVPDLKYITDKDLVACGMSAVVARKFLAASSSTSSSSAVSKAGATVAPGAFSAEDTMKIMAKKGISSADRDSLQIFCSSFLGGALLGWGCALTTVVAGGSAVLLSEAPGLLALLTGAIFPVGISMVVLSGSELLTGNFMLMTLPAWTHPTLSKGQVLARTCYVWGVSGLGNLAGSLFVASALYALSVVPVGSQAAGWLTALTVKKCALAPMAAVGKGACANWLVNIGIFQASSAHTTAGKIASLWLPIMTFVTLGLEHSVANMFLLPLGYLVGADVSSVSIANNIVPVALGNAMGAIFFVAFVQRYSLLRNLVYTKPI